MKKITFSLLIAFHIFIFFTNISNSQVGFGTTLPAIGSLLDIDSSDKGILLPRIPLLNTLDSTTITDGASTGLLIYNTNTSGVGTIAVSLGFYYWDGIQWIRIQSNDNYWKINGNENITGGINFLGTTNNRRIDFKANNVDKLRIPGNANQIQVLINGTNSSPMYSWQEETQLGLWRPGTNRLAMSTANTEFLRISQGATNEIIVNEGAIDLDTRIKTSANEQLFFVDASTNRIGINSQTPQTTFHVAGNGTTLRVEELNQTYNSFYTSNDPMPLYVDTSGDIMLRPSLVQNFMALNIQNFIPTSGVVVGRSDGSEVNTNIGNLQTITLTQESVVHINYQFSVRISNNTPTGNPFPNDHGVINDGAPRHYSSWVEVNGVATRIAFDSDYYTNLSGSGGGAYAAGYFYLAGKGTMVLPAGMHNFQLVAQTYAGTNKSYRFVFADTAHERFQIIIQR